MVTQTQNSPAVVEQPQGKPSETEKGSEAQPQAGAGEVGKAQPIDLDKLLENPELRSRFERKVQSRVDQILTRQQAQWKAQQEAAEAERQRQEARKSQLAMDEFQLGEQRKKELAAEEEREKFNRGYEVALSEGEKRAWAQMRAALEGIGDWQEMSPTERQDLINNSANPAEMLAKLIETASDRRSKKQLQSELAKYQTKVESEKSEEARASEPSPDTGTGAPGSSDDEFIAAYARGDAMSPAQHARALKLLNMRR